MATGWAGDGAVQDQIDATVQDGINRVSYEVRLRQDAARLIGVEKIGAVVTIDKGTASIVRISSTLHQPVRVLMGLARINNLDVDLQIEPWDEMESQLEGAETGGGRIEMSRLGGSYAEYSWSDFRRVTEFPGQ